jgi:hypothetical protein
MQNWYKLLIFAITADVSATFCSRLFHLIRCDFVAVFSRGRGAALVFAEHKPDALVHPLQKWWSCR